jgi:crotonobetainyl-CoA:carnitine CoA-transferase CaiB-like acyl-CoA transferase
MRKKQASMAGALERLTVLHLSSHLAGPHCAMLLADHDANVIKIEKPGRKTSVRIGAAAGSRQHGAGGGADDACSRSEANRSGTDLGSRKRA